MKTRAGGAGEFQNPQAECPANFFQLSIVNCQLSIVNCHPPAGGAYGARRIINLALMLVGG